MFSPGGSLEVSLDGNAIVVMRLIASQASTFSTLALDHEVATATPPRKD